jgi:hypothetical protein
VIIYITLWLLYCDNIEVLFLRVFYNVTSLAGLLSQGSLAKGVLGSIQAYG